MKKVKLGIQGLKVTRLGLGCMPLTAVYGNTNTVSSKKVIERALELGINFFDSADVYGSKKGENEILIGEALVKVRNKVVIATKFGIIGSKYDKNGTEELEINGSAEYVLKSCDDSLKRLNTDYIDLYYLHRMDPKIPLEETIGAMKKLVEAGKVKYIGVSEANAEELERANKICPITAIQSEYSLWTREIEKVILPKARELEIGIVPYSPLGRGFLTGAIKDAKSLSDNDWRKLNPRFSQEAIEKNLSVIKILEEIAEKKKCSVSEVALAWVLAQGEDIIPIPGTKQIKNLESNVRSLNIKFTKDELNFLSDNFSEANISGTRY